MRAMLLQSCLLASIIVRSSAQAASIKHAGRTWLVESTPLNTSLAPLPGTRQTWEVLTTFISEAQHKIDLTAMYWELVVAAGTYTPEEEERWDTMKGKRVYDALWNAARRGVVLRALCGIGISGVDEFERIRKAFPERVSYQIYNASQWYGGGIMHQKAWIFDDTRAFVTSSNTDWKSLTQVKELGIAVEGPPGFVAVQDLQSYFHRWWAWTAPGLLTSLSQPKVVVFDPYVQHNRSVPCFQKMVDWQSPQCANPLPSSTRTLYNVENQMPLIFNGTPAHTFFSCSPPAVCDTPIAVYSLTSRVPSGRTWDGDALVHTIVSARKSVSLSVMDYIPSTMYDDKIKGLWWPALNDALLSKLSEGLSIRLLISRWAHTKKQMEVYLLSLAAAAAASLEVMDKTLHPNASFEIRMFEISGWDHTGNRSLYPSFTRVNHAKYIVTDSRFNVGTSNMEWSYFYNTAGTSFNSDNRLLRAQIQAVFDRDWNSDYAKPLRKATIASADRGDQHDDLYSPLIL